MNRLLIYLLPFALVVSLAACNTAEQHDHQAEKDAHKVASFAWHDLTTNDTIYLGDTARTPYVYYNSGWKKAHLVQCVSRSAYCDCEFSTEDLKPGGSDTLWVVSVPPDTGRFVVYLDITHTSPQPKFLISQFVDVLPREK